MLVDGVTVEYRRPTARSRGDQARVIDFDDPTNNDWLAVNQFTVVEDKHKRRPDIVLFVNGLPLAVIELKNAADENATIWTRVQPAPDLQGSRSRRCSRYNEAAGRLRRRARPASARSRAERGVVHALADDRGRGRWPTAHMPRAAGGARGRVRASAGSSTWSGTSSCSRTTAAGSSSRRWPATTSSTR